MKKTELKKIIREEIIVLKEDVFKKNQIAIARKTLKMSDAGANVFGGMTKDEARKILKKYNIKEVSEKQIYPKDILSKMQKVLLKKFGGDPIYKDFILAKNVKEREKTKEILIHIRGLEAFNQVMRETQKFFKEYKKGVKEEIEITEGETDITKIPPKDAKKIIAQYEALRRAGQYNMYNFFEVQRAAFENKFNDFVNFTQNNKEAYSSILHNYNKLIKLIKDKDIPKAKRLKVKYTLENV